MVLLILVYPQDIKTLICTQFKVSHLDCIDNVYKGNWTRELLSFFKGPSACMTSAVWFTIITYNNTFAYTFVGVKDEEIYVLLNFWMGTEEMLYLSVLDLRIVHKIFSYPNFC